MPVFNFGVDMRFFGNISVEADDPDEAETKLTKHLEERASVADLLDAHFIDPPEFDVTYGCEISSEADVL